MKFIAAVLGLLMVVSSVATATNMLGHVSFTNTVGFLVEIDVVDVRVAGLQYQSKKGPGLYRWDDLPSEVAKKWKPLAPVSTNVAPIPASKESIDDVVGDSPDSPAVEGAKLPARPKMAGKDMLSKEYLLAWKIYYSHLAL